MHYYWKSEFLPGVTNELLDTYRAQFVGMEAPANQIVLFHLEGALSEHAEDDGAVGNRDAAYACVIQSMFSEGSRAADENRRWVRSAWHALQPFSTGGNYINFQTADESEDRLAGSYRENMKRLSRIKAEYDRENLSGESQHRPSGLTWAHPAGRRGAAGDAASLHCSRGDPGARDSRIAGIAGCSQHSRDTDPRPCPCSRHRKGESRARGFPNQLDMAPMLSAELGLLAVAQYPPNRSRLIKRAAGFRRRAAAAGCQKVARLPLAVSGPALPTNTDPIGRVRNAEDLRQRFP